jgi:L-fuconate dehydratase
MSSFTALRTYDVRFPTSRSLDGSDAMNPTPDYAAAYVVLATDADDGLEGHGFAFTIGRGNEVQLSAARALEPFVVGRSVEEVLDDLGAFSRQLVWDSPLRWLGPEKGIVHMAIGSVVNAMWDLRAKRAGRPLWRLLCELEPDEVVELVDFRYLTDVLEREEALALLRTGRAGAEERVRELEADGYPAYSTSVGWMGYSDDRIATLCAEAVAAGFGLVKLKVGASSEQDRRRCAIAREAIGPSTGLAVDANQVWSVPEAPPRVRELAEFDLAWVEEPTSPDEVLGLAAIRRAVEPVPVASGEHVANRVVFKQLLQCAALDVMQIDACRVAGVNENLANLLLAAKFGVPVVPHAGGVGLCEVVQHLAMFDHVALGGLRTGREWRERPRLIEWVDHLHEQFVHPARVSGGRYVVPSAPGASTELRAESLREFSYPSGTAWVSGEPALPASAR